MFYKYLPNFNYFKSKSHGKAVKKACLCDHHQQLNIYVSEMRYTTLILFYLF